MKKTALILMCVLTSFSIVRADQTPKGIKDLASQQIIDYAQALYNRNDFEESAHAFTRALELNPQNTTAREYLVRIQNKHIPGFDCCAMPAIPVVAIPVPEVASTAILIPAEQPYVPHPIDTNEDIKNAIHEEDQALGILKQEISQMHNEMERSGNE